MLNIIIKKFNPTLLYKIIKYKSNINIPIDGWIDTINNKSTLQSSKI